MRPTDLISFLDEVMQLEKNEAFHSSLMWHAGLGDGRLRALANPPVYYREAVRALEALRQKAVTLGGNLVVENASLEIKKEFDSWGNDGSSAELMRRVKAQLDPQGLLAPGRFGAGI